MELDLSDDQRLFHETTRKFLDATMATTAVRALADSSDGFGRDWWRAACDLGWTSLLVAAEHGGGAISTCGLADLVTVAEELGRHVAPGPVVPVNVVAGAVSRFGTDEQCAAVLPGLLDGSQIAAWCYRDRGGAWTGSSDFGSRAAATRAVPSADGWIITGTKVMVEAGARADWLLVTAAGQDKPMQFLLPAGTPGGTPGVEIVSSTSIDMVRRYATVTFNDVQAAASEVLGSSQGSAAAQIEHQLQVALVLQCAEMAGAAGRVFEFTTEYAMNRFSFGRPLASYQALKHRFADMKSWLEASYATTLAAAAVVGDEDGHPAATRLASVAKAYVADRSPEIVQDCIQMHGGIGVTWEHDLHLFLRRVTLLAAMYGGVDEHHERIAAMVIEREDALHGNR